MSNIVICRKHGKSRVDARDAAEKIASRIKEEFDLSYAWEGEVMHFKRPGVSGELTVDSDEIVLRIQLGLLLLALKPRIERDVHKYFDESLPSP